MKPFNSNKLAVKDHRITVRLDLKRFALLSEYAESEGFTVSAIVRHVVNRFIEQQRKGGSIPEIGNEKPVLFPFSTRI